MSDITKCSTEGCPVADKCYRKLAKTNLVRQSIQDFLRTGGSCGYYWPMPWGHANLSLNPGMLPDVEVSDVT